MVSTVETSPAYSDEVRNETLDVIPNSNFKVW